MKKKYIETETFKAYLRDLRRQVNDIIPGVNVISTKSVSQLIDEYPAANVVETRHGEWIVAETEYAWNCAEYPISYKCSKCEYVVKAGLEDNYCPHCGADMRGEAIE